MRLQEFYDNVIVNKENALNKVAEEIRACPQCRKGGAGLPVPGEGSGELPVLFVGEAPGRKEAETGRPFVGRSGRLLRQMIREIGLDEKRIFITSPVHYFPGHGKPAPALVEHGVLHLLKQICIIRPLVIVLMGNTACRALLGRNAEMAKEHGSVVGKEGALYFITYHPAYAARFPEGKKNFPRDFLLLKDLLEKVR